MDSSLPGERSYADFEHDLVFLHGPVERDDEEGTAGRDCGILGSLVCLPGQPLFKPVEKASYIVEIRDLWPRTLIELGSMSKYHPAVLMFGAIEKFVYKRADQIIVTLPGAAEYIKEMGVDESIIHVIPNGINMDRMEEKEGKSSLREEIESIKEKHGQVAMYVGSHGVANSWKPS